MRTAWGAGQCSSRALQGERVGIPTGRQGEGDLLGREERSRKLQALSVGVQSAMRLEDRSWRRRRGEEGQGEKAESGCGGVGGPETQACAAGIFFSGE